MPAPFAGRGCEPGIDGLLGSRPAKFTTFPDFSASSPTACRSPQASQELACRQVGKPRLDLGISETGIDLSAKRFMISEPVGFARCQARSLQRADGHQAELVDGVGAPRNTPGMRDCDGSVVVATARTPSSATRKLEARDRRRLIQGSQLSFRPVQRDDDPVVTLLRRPWQSSDGCLGSAVAWCRVQSGLDPPAERE